MPRQSRQLSGLHPEEIKARIRMRGQTLVGLARKNHLSESYLRNALARPLYRGEQIIAAFLQLRPHEIWPDRYDESDTPIYQLRRERQLAQFRARRAA